MQIISILQFGVQIGVHYMYTHAGIWNMIWIFMHNLDARWYFTNQNHETGDLKN